MKTFFSLAFFIAATLSLLSQTLEPEVITTSGGFGENSNASISWTIGEPVIETFQDTGAILTQGFHQTNLTVVQVEKINTEILTCSVFPNPTSDHVTVKIENVNNEIVSLELYDAKGVILFSKTVTEQITNIDFSDYQTANYFLKVYVSGKKHYTYQINKTY